MKKPLTSSCELKNADAQYKMELISSESDSGDESATVVRGITYKPFNAMKKPKRSRLPVDSGMRENLKGCVISVCILLTFSFVLWLLGLSILLAEALKKMEELQNVSQRTSAETDELSKEITSWRNFSKTIKNDQIANVGKTTHFERELGNLTMSLSELEKKLTAFEGKASKRELLDGIQEQVCAMASSIAGLNGEVENLKSKMAEFRDDNDRREHILLNLKVNASIHARTISMLNSTVQDAIKSATNARFLGSQAIESFSSQVTAVNESLSELLRYLSENQQTDHNLVIDVQKSFANISSQVISLLHNAETWKTKFNNLELKILTIGEQLKAVQSTPFDKVNNELKATLGATTCSEETIASKIVKDQHSIKQGGTFLISSVNMLPSTVPKYG